jgi:hypothetical protein
MQKAAELLGGRDELAKALQVPSSEIEKWIAEQSKPPREIFLRVVDIILDETAAGAADDSPEAPPGREAAGPSRYVD